MLLEDNPALLWSGDRSARGDLEPICVCPARSEFCREDAGSRPTVEFVHQRAYGELLPCEGVLPWEGVLPGVPLSPVVGALPVLGALPAFGALPEFGVLPVFGTLPDDDPLSDDEPLDAGCTLTEALAWALVVGFVTVAL